MKGTPTKLTFGDRFGNLTYLADATSCKSPGGTSRRRVFCVCDCGSFVRVHLGNLQQGGTTSCGCARLKAVTTHGMCHHPLYKTWQNMMSRCNNTNVPEYKHYGRRGITVSPEWRNIKNFLDDMYPSYESHLTLDRINNNAGYSRENCRWATNAEQGQNTRTTRLSVSLAKEIREKYSTGTISLSLLATEYNVGKTTIFSVIKRRTWKNETNNNKKRRK